MSFLSRIFEQEYEKYIETYKCYPDILFLNIFNLNHCPISSLTSLSHEIFYKHMNNEVIFYSGKLKDIEIYPFWSPYELESAFFEKHDIERVHFNSLKNMHGYESAKVIKYSYDNNYVQYSNTVDFPIPQPFDMEINIKIYYLRIYEDYNRRKLLNN